MRAVPTLLCGSAHVPGWTFSSEEIAGTDEVVVDGEPVTQMRITATRSGATVAFGIVILGLMAVLPVLGLTVAIIAYRGIRKVEATLMSWMAAMLFATIPLRTFLPGSPPDRLVGRLPRRAVGRRGTRAGTGDLRPRVAAVGCARRAGRAGRVDRGGRRRCRGGGIRSRSGRRGSSDAGLGCRLV